MKKLSIRALILLTAAATLATFIPGGCAQAPESAEPVPASSAVQTVGDTRGQNSDEPTTAAPESAEPQTTAPQSVEPATTAPQSVEPATTALQIAEPAAPSANDGNDGSAASRISDAIGASVQRAAVNEEALLSGSEWKDVTKNNAPIRTDCKKSAAVVRELPVGSIICVTGSKTNSSGNLWYKTSGGYIFSGNVKAHTNHKYSLSSARPSTCYSEGEEIYRCVCGSYYTKSIGRVGHKWGSDYFCSYGCGNYTGVSYTSYSGGSLVVTKAGPAHSGPYGKCSETAHYSAGKLLSYSAEVKNGHGNLWYKLSNGSFIFSDYVKVHNTHNWDGGRVTKSPTCKDYGVRTYTCRTCGVTTVESIAKTGHKYDSKKYMCVYGCGSFNPSSVKTTSTASGMLYVKTDCYVHTGPYGDCAKTHNYKKGVLLGYSATVSNGYGNKWYKLSNGYYVFSDYVQIHNSHNWDGGKVTKAPTCKSTGVRTYTCKVCGNNSKTESVPKVGHKYDSKTFMCVYGCGNYNPSSVSVTNVPAGTLYVKTDCVRHNGPYGDCATTAKSKKGDTLTYIATVKNGYKRNWFKLVTGDYVFSDYVQIHNSHNWDGGKVTKAPTCKSTGVRTYTCKVCGNKSKTESVPKVGHKYSSSNYFCTYGCGKYDPSSVTTTSTKKVNLFVTEDGSVSRSGPYKNCPAKNTYSKGTKLAAVAAVKNGYKSTWYKLSDGNYIYASNVELEHVHSWGSGKVTKSPTCKATGVRTYTCKCGKTKTETVAKVGHKYDSKTFMCTYGCGNFNPASVKVISTASQTLYVKKDGAVYRKGPYSGCATVGSYKKNAEVKIASTLTNGQGNKWYRMTNGYYIYSDNVSAPVCKISGSESAFVEIEKQLKAEVFPTSVTTKWSSSDTSAATVDSSGRVTFKKPGTAKITVSFACGSKTYKAVCTVTGKNLTYTVKYYSNIPLMISVTPAKTQTCIYSKSYKFSGAVTERTGYTQTGWSKTKDGSVSYKAGEAFKNLTKTDGAAINLYAVWRANTLSVNYNACGGTVGITNLGGKVYNDSLAENGDIIVGDTTKPFAQKMTYNNDCGFYSNSAFGLKKTGYTFTTWNTKADGSGSNFILGKKYTPSKLKSNIKTGDCSMRVYAQWVPVSYKIKFDGNGAASGTMSERSFIYDKEQALPKSEFKAPANYKFLGWSDKKNGNVIYKNGQKVKNLRSTAGTLTLYAVWGYTVTYYPNGGDGGPAAVNAIKGRNLVFENCGFARHLYYCTGWNTKADGSGTQYSQGQSIPEPKHPSAAVSYYATWESIEKKLAAEMQVMVDNNQKFDIYSMDYNISYTDSDGKAIGYYVRGNGCTWYAAARYRQVNGSDLKFAVGGGNAGQWANTIDRRSFDVVSSSDTSRYQHNMIGVDCEHDEWEQGMRGSGNHVVYVEAVWDGYVYYSDGSYGSSQSKWGHVYKVPYAIFQKDYEYMIIPK